MLWNGDCRTPRRYSVNAAAVCINLNSCGGCLCQSGHILFWWLLWCRAPTLGPPGCSSSGFQASVSSVAQSCPTLCNPMDYSTPGLPVHHQLPEFTHPCPLSRWCHPTISSPSPPTFNLSQHQGLFKWVSSLHQVAKVLEFQLQHQSFQWIIRTDFL